MQPSSSDSIDSSVESIQSTFLDGAGGSKSKTSNVDDALEYCGWTSVQTFTCVAAGINWLADAIELMLLSYLLPQLEREWNLSFPQPEFIASALFAGIAIGSSIWGMLADRYGRRPVYFFSSIGTSIMGLTTAFAPNYWTMVLFRGMLGLFLGGAPVAYTMQLEVAIPSKRALIMNLFHIWFSVGTVAEAAMATGILSADSLPFSPWRLLCFVSALPEVICIVLAIWLAESPHFLSASHQDEKLDQFFDKQLRLSGKNKPWTALETVVPKRDQSNKQMSIKSLITSQYRLRFIMCLLLWGAVSLTYYGSVLFVGIFFESYAQDNAQLSLLYIFLTALAEVPGALVAAFLVNRVGRKRLMVVFFALCSICFFLLNAATHLQWYLALMSCISRACIFGAFSTIYLYTPECFPSHLRATAVGTCAAFSKVCTIASPFVGGYGSEGVLIPSLIFGAMSVFGCLTSLFLPLETTGANLSSEIWISDKEDETETDPLIRKQDNDFD